MVVVRRFGVFVIRHPFPVRMLQSVRCVDDEHHPLRLSQLINIVSHRPNELAGHPQLSFMQLLAIALSYMIRLSVVISLSKLGNSARNGWSSTTARTDALLTQCSRSFTARPLSSSSTPQSGAGQESATNKNYKKLEKPVAQGSQNASREHFIHGVNHGERSKGQPRQNSAGRRVYETDRRTNPLRDDRNKPKAPPQNAFEQFTQEFRQVIRSRQFGPAMALYARMKEIKLHPRESVLTGLLSICQKKEHLVNAVEIFADFISCGIPPNESAYMSLIRCYSDNGQIKEALELIDEMNRNKLGPKLRTYHPVLEAVCKNNDFKGAIMIIKQMQTGSVVPRSEQLTLLLEVAASSKSLDSNEGREQIDQLLQSASIDLLGMETQEMRRVVSAFCDIGPTDVVNEGILIETRDDLPGEILEIDDDSNTSIITSMNSTYPGTPTLLTDMKCSPVVSDNIIPLGFDVVNSVGGW